MKSSISYKNALKTLEKHMLVDGFPIVWDYEASHGNILVDGATGKEYLDLFGFFASNPLGHNHPKLTQNDAADELARVAPLNPSNSDIYTVEMAEFVETFMSTAVPKPFEHVFFVAGGAMAVENAIKAAFDWKVKKNFAAGLKEEKGLQVIHFKEAFHGRSGYTLSLTNNIAAKISDHYPKFNWPQIDNPKVNFPIEEHLEEIELAEANAVAQIEQAFADNPDDIAAILIEPIQGEGGDNHFRPEFLQKLKDLADSHEAMLIFDEVQTGLGGTGSWWAFQQLGVTPDMVCFGKKTQVCGFFAGPKIDEVDDNVFTHSGRINSTWGGNLVDMVRSKHYIQIIEEDHLLAKSSAVGTLLLDGLKQLQQTYPEMISNVRGMGLFCAFSLSTTEQRNDLVSALFQQGVLIPGVGANSVRFRPALTLTDEEATMALDAIENVIQSITLAKVG